MAGNSLRPDSSLLSTEMFTISGTIHRCTPFRCMHADCADSAGLAGQSSGRCKEEDCDLVLLISFNPRYSVALFPLLLLSHPFALCNFPNSADPTLPHQRALHLNSFCDQSTIDSEERRS